MSNLVIVESPAKSKTIKKYLGKDYEILASYGHVRDLVPKEGAVDPDNNFEMKYEAVSRNSKYFAPIAKAAPKANAIYLATDPDREGEAIAWHVIQLLKEKGKLPDIPIYRVVFHEITSQAVQQAVDNPRDIEMDLVYAQQARRALDYLVGFNLSPLLWRKVRKGLSAGRVQSPALRLIVEREQEIEAFEAQEYWSLTAQCAKQDREFQAKLVQYKGNKLRQFDVNQEEQAKTIKQALVEAAQGALEVVKVDKKQRKRNPAPPFITSTLQQEAIRKLGFTAQRAMRVAQQLYEGMEVDGESVGLITYMRTDSVNLSQEAIRQIRDYISQTYGSNFVPNKPRAFQSKSKNAQEAHEAIRPTDVNRSPAKLKSILNQEQYKLYSLIWQRAVACQMIHATIDTVSIDLTIPQTSGSELFRATGSVINKPGFITVYQESTDEDQADKDNEQALPAMEQGETVALNDIVAKQHFTEPPPRYSEARLVKTLEEYGIGRPSTYASIISTIQQREYAYLEKKRFKPTDIGRIVNKFLTEYFAYYVDYSFTAKLEDKLDAVARGEKQWIPLLEEFWKPFIKQINYINDNVQRKDVTQEEIDEQCPKCNKPLSIRLGRGGRFIGCTGYPDCDYTRSMEGEETTEPEEITDRVCPKCENKLLIRHGRYGKFIGCSNYPKCKHIEPLHPPEDTGVKCPQCHQGQLVKRRSRYGKYFYSCERYPDCKYAVFNPPLTQSCPECQWPILTQKETKRYGKQKVCPQKSCNYKVKIEEAEDSSS